jgi:hypothetical protein
MQFCVRNYATYFATIYSQNVYCMIKITNLAMVHMFDVIRAKQERQCTYNVTLRSVRETVVTLEKQ